ncbi:MAG: acyl-ACP--UDP-N-acetylglucosamine O-acyltransferase [Candidatus Rokubacteria bacterium]|nr:acyl-ACP--UDP-N-acetylglucosamine O-acyltransferase [Candidatus Rokubacteria bacterium]
MIHPTAIVAPGAQLGANVRVGPYAIVGPDVVIGDGAEVAGHALLDGRVILGARVRVGHGAVVGGEPQDLKFKPGTPAGVRVGAGTVIREYVTIHRATHADAWTEIGEDCLLMAMCHVAHDCRVGHGVIIINYAGVTGHCEIGDRATVGGYAGIVPFTRIGTHAYIGGCAKINQDVPPFMLAEGNLATVRGVNVVGLRRAGITPAERRALRDAHRLLYRSGLAPAAALERMRTEIEATPQVKELIAFVETAKRGILGPPGGAGADGAEEA